MTKSMWRSIGTAASLGTKKAPLTAATSSAIQSRVPPAVGSFGRSRSSPLQISSHSSHGSTTLPWNCDPQQQRRSFWMDVVQIKPQKANRRFKPDDTKSKHAFVHEDPEQVVRRHTDETRSDGESLLDLMFHNDRHEKAWKKRQRLMAQKRYEFDKKHVNDLAKYIAFVQDHNSNDENPGEKSK